MQQLALTYILGNGNTPSVMMKYLLYLCFVGVVDEEMGQTH